MVVIGSDHAGFTLKKDLIAAFKKNFRINDVGAYGARPSDYPDFALKVALAVLGHCDRRGILICGSGVGAAIAANKIPGIRAGLCHDTYSAHQGVEHDDMNVLVLGSRIIGLQLAEELVMTFLAARFSHAPKHQRRLDKIRSLEVRYGHTNSEDESLTRIKRTRTGDMA